MSYSINTTLLTGSDPSISFPSAPVVRAAKDFVEKRYGIRECEAIAPDADCHRHCLADVIRTCSAPCLGKITREKYRECFEEACAFLEGKRPQDLEEVESRMREAAEKGDYEHAARLRDTVFALKEMTKAHFIRKSPHMWEEDAARGLEELAEVAGVNATVAAEVRRVASSAASERT